MAAMTRLSLTLDPMGISHFHLFFWNHKTDLNQTWQKCSLDGHIQDFCMFSTGPPNDHSCKVTIQLAEWFLTRRFFKFRPIRTHYGLGISHFHPFFWNHKTDLNQTWQKCSLDGHIQDLCFWCWSENQEDF
jgi:hypothetical protein